MVFFIFWVLFGIGCAICASNKNRSAVGWFFLGILLGPFGLLFILLLNPLDKSTTKAPITIWGWSVTALVIIFLFIGVYYADETKEKSVSGSSPALTAKTNQRRGSSPIGRAYLAAGITKTLKKIGYPAKWTILGDTHDGSPVLILECAKFSEKSIQGFIEQGILSDIKADCFDRVDFLNGRRNWSYELNQTHIRPRPRGKSYHFYSNLTPVEFDQVDKQFDQDHGL